MLKIQLRLILMAIAIAFIYNTFVLSETAEAQIPIKGGIEFGISGMSIVTENDQQTSLLIVHDNKGGREQGRLGLIKLISGQNPQYLPIAWDNSPLPLDLESLTHVPLSDTFLAVASNGEIYHFQLDAAQQKIKLISSFKLPKSPSNSNFEAFDLYQLEDRLLAIWAHRGEGQDPAILYWGWLDLAKDQITPLGSISIKVPFPLGNVRHISDLKIDPTGILYFTAATDNGNDGPFTSAVYVGGFFQKQDDQVIFQINQELFPLYRLDHHKVEGLELIRGKNGGIILGTDDENFGSFMGGTTVFTEEKVN